MALKASLTNYGSALFSLAKEDNQVEAYLSSLEEIVDFLKNNAEIAQFLESFAVNEESKKDVIKKIAEPYSLAHLYGFLALLSQHHYIGRLDEVLTAYRNLANEHLGIKEGIVYSATPLSKEDMKRIGDLLEKDLDSKASLTNRIESSLIGGIRIYIDEKVYDASVKGKLERMRKQLLNSYEGGKS